MPVPLRTRAALYAFLGAFVVCAVVGVEAWPLTGWRLFSRLRTAEQVTFDAVYLRGDGVEERVPVDRLPRGYRGVLQVVEGASAADDATRREVCDAYLAGVRQVDPRAVAVVLRRVERRQPLSHEPPAVTRVDVVEACGAGAP